MRDDKKKVAESAGYGRGSGRKTTMSASPRRWWVEGKGSVDRLKAGSKKQAAGRGSGRTTQASRKRSAIDFGNR